MKTNDTHAYSFCVRHGLRYTAFQEGLYMVWQVLESVNLLSKMYKHIMYVNIALVYPLKYISIFMFFRKHRWWIDPKIKFRKKVILVYPDFCKKVVLVI